jgi:Zn-finger nucleic acid-binding protein
MGMNCPVCKTIGLNSTTLERELPASVCPQCGGTWISSTHYFTWLEKQGPHVAGKPAPGTPPPVSDSKGAKICCECGGILIRYHVGQEVPFAIEQCGRCKGIWLDKNEWAVLKAHNFHDELHLIFQSGWQKEIGRGDYLRKVQQSYEKQLEDYQRRVQQAYEKRFGPEIYAEINRIREWLAKQPHKAALLSYLNESAKE